MSDLRSLQVGFDLPFDCRINVGLMHEPLIVTIYPLRTRFTDGQLALLETHVRVFMDAALFGLGSGRLAMPRLSGNLTLEPLLHITAPTDERPWLMLQAAGLAIDPAYVMVLLHKLRCLALDGLPIDAVAVAFPFLSEGSRTIDLIRSDISDLPEISHDCQFERDFTLLDSYYSSCCISVDFARALTPGSSKVVESAFRVWAAQCLQGGYTSKIFDCHLYSLVPDTVSLLGDRIEWNLDKVNVDRRAFNALANFLIALSHELAPVTRLVIE
jgi:hypothetical protein